jgi:hypothetical protein
MTLISTLKAISASLRVTKILLSDYRYFGSMRDGEIKDKTGYVPWFTYPAVELLKSWDLSDKSVLEYGAGYSTLFWASRTRQVLSIEHNEEWHKKIARLVPSNVDLQLRTLDQYPEVEGSFDIIVNDGYARERTRYRCAKASLPHLNSGGFIILDNSDWLPATCFYLREKGLIQMDFSGFVAGNPHTQTTSFFLTRDFKPRIIKLFPTGGTGYNWESKLEKELRAERYSELTTEGTD